MRNDISDIHWTGFSLSPYHHKGDHIFAHQHMDETMHHWWWVYWPQSPSGILDPIGPFCCPLYCEDFPGLSFTGISTGTDFSVVWTPHLVFLWHIRTSSMPCSIAGTGSSAWCQTIRWRNYLFGWKDVWRYQLSIVNEEWSLSYVCISIYICLKPSTILSHITPARFCLANGFLFPYLLLSYWFCFLRLSRWSYHVMPIKPCVAYSDNSKTDMWLEPYVSLH